MEVIENRGDSRRIARDYFDGITFPFRMINAEPASTEITLFGERFSTPVMTAALSRLHEVCPDGAAEMARGAKMAGAVH